MKAKLLAVIVVYAWSGLWPAAAEEPPAATRDAQWLRDGLVKYYARLAGVKSLKIVYTGITKQIELGSHVGFVWTTLSSEHDIKGGKHYIAIKGSDDKGLYPLDRKLSWDAATGRDKDGGRMFAIYAFVPDHVYIYSAYMQQMFDPEIIKNYEKHAAPREKYSAKDYALPDAVADQLRDYSVRPRLEREEGDWCHVLERKALDVIWIDADHGCRIKRRDFNGWPDKSLRDRTFHLVHKEVEPGLWLPTKTVQEYYTSPFDSPEIQHRIAYRQTLSVSTLESGTVDDSVFTNLMPDEGSIVYDDRKQAYFTYTKTDQSPFEKSLVAAQVQTGESGSLRNLWLINLLLLVSALLVVVWQAILRRRKAISGRGLQ